MDDDDYVTEIEDTVNRIGGFECVGCRCVCLPDSLCIGKWTREDGPAAFYAICRGCVNDLNDMSDWSAHRQTMLNRIHDCILEREAQGA